MPVPVILDAFTPGEVLAEESWTSPEISFGAAHTSADGNTRLHDLTRACTLDVTFTGTGKLTAELLAANGAVFSTPEGATALLSAKAAGAYFVSFTAPVCRAFKLKLTSSADGAMTVSSAIVALG